MEPGKIRLINSGGTSDAGFTQTIAVSVGNRLYRVTNNGSAELVQVARGPLEHGIVVSPGESFGDGGQGYFRIALVPTLDQIDRAIAVWEKISL